MVSGTHKKDRQMNKDEKQSMRGLILFAIDQENDAANLYEQYAQKSKSRSTRELLLSMAKEERSHEQKLKNYLTDRSESFPEIDSVQDLHVSDYMVPTPINENSSIDQVYTFSMKCEEKANALYTKLAEMENDREAKRILLSLAEEEKKHKIKLESDYEEMFTREN